MPTKKKIKDIHRIGLLAGGGDLPARIIEDCKAKGIEVFLIGFEGQTNPALKKECPHLWTRLGAAGKIIKTLKNNDIEDIVLAGAISRPGLSMLRPDLKAAQILSRIGLRALGDNTLLSALRKELEAEGFFLHGVQKFSDHLIAAEGCIGKLGPKKEDDVTITLGLQASQMLGMLDIGQSVVVQGGLVLGVEAAEGTDRLIERCGELKHKKERGPILVKSCKPQQDQDMDLPTIGPETIIKLHKHGYCGVVIHAGQSIILDVKSVAELADQYKIFVLGKSTQ